MSHKHAWLHRLCVEVVDVENDVCEDHDLSASQLQEPGQRGRRGAASNGFTPFSGIVEASHSCFN